jgi:hypothetical protein
MKQTTSTNCLQACVAFILQLPIDEVPRACDGDPEHWNWCEFQNWLAKLPTPMQAIEVILPGAPVFVATPVSVPCVLTFEAPDEPVTGKHAVVGEFIGVEGFRILHDPHWSDKELTGELESVMFFVPINPAQQQAVVAPSQQQAVVSLSQQP